MSTAAEQLLRARARDLARPLAARRGPGIDAVLLRRAGARYALALEDAVRILTVAELAPLPGARPPLAGVVPWRGGLLPLVDLRLLAGAGDAGIGDLTHIVVVGDVDEAAGILAEAVEDLVDLDPAEIRPLRDHPGEVRHLRGITPDAVLVLDGAGLLTLLRGG